jgi:hypothetical protein
MPAPKMAAQECCARKFSNDVLTRRRRGCLLTRHRMSAFGQRVLQRSANARPNSFELNGLNRQSVSVSEKRDFAGERQHSVWCKAGRFADRQLAHRKAKIWAYASKCLRPSQIIERRRGLASILLGNQSRRSSVRDLQDALAAILLLVTSCSPVAANLPPRAIRANRRWPHWSRQ